MYSYPPMLDNWQPPGEPASKPSRHERPTTMSSKIGVALEYSINENCWM
jgi:hypothetical protein